MCYRTNVNLQTCTWTTREKKIVMNLNLCEPTYSSQADVLRKYSQYNVVEKKKWTATVIHSPIDFLYVRKFGKPYIWGIWDNHTHMLCVGCTQQKMKFILRITMHFGPELNDIHMVNNNTSHKKFGSKQRKNLKQPNHLRFNGRTMARCDTFFRGIFW